MPVHQPDDRLVEREALPRARQLGQLALAPGELAHGLRPRPERRGAAAVPAPAEHHRTAGGAGGPRGLLGEARLADPRLSRDQHDPVVRHGDGVRQQGGLPRPAHQRRRLRLGQGGCGGDRAARDQRGILGEYRPLHLAGARVGVEAQLLDQQPPSLGERGQGVGLPSCLVERVGAQAAQTFAQGKPGEEPGQLGHHPGPDAETELRLGGVLHQRQPQLAEVGDLRTRPGVLLEARERVSPPLGERAAQLAPRPGQVAAAEQPRPLRRVRPGPREVKALVGNDQGVTPELAHEDAGGHRADASGLQDPAELGDVRLDGVERARGRLVLPERLDDPRGAHRARRGQHAHGQDGLLLVRSEVKGALAVGEHADRTKQAKLHASPLDARAGLRRY